MQPDLSLADAPIDGQETAALIGEAEAEMASEIYRLIGKYLTDRHAKGEINTRSMTQERYRLYDFAQSTGRALDKIGPKTVEAWLATEDLSPAYRRSRFYTLRLFCRWCVLHGHMVKDPTLGLTTPRVPVGMPRALPLDAARKAIEGAADSRTRLIMVLMLQEGLRRIEVARIQMADLDMARGSLGIRGKGGLGKTTRTVPISDETRRALVRYLADHEVSNGRLIRSHKNPHRGISEQTVSQLVLNTLRQTGIKSYNGDGCSAHALRHTMAQDMLDSGADIRQVQAALGHATVKTTEIYLRGQVKGLREAMGGRSYMGAA